MSKVILNSFVLIFFSQFFFLCSVLAAEFYVEPKGTHSLNVANNGSGAWNDAINIATPCSAGTAMVYAVAGDIVYFRGGTYELGQSDNNQKGSGVLYPRNSGTSDKNRIVFTAYQNENPILNTTVSGNIISRAWGNRGQSYATLKGMTISSTGDTKCASVGIGEGSKGTVVENCIFLGSSTPGNNSDNISGVAMAGSTNAVIKDCRFLDYRDQNNWHNTSAIKTYETNYLKVINCEFVNCTVGIYDKRGNYNNTYMNNFFKDCYIGFFVTINSSNANDSKVYNNLFVNMSYYGAGIDSSGPRSADNWSFYNNTFYNNNKRMIPLGYGKGQLVYNNLFVGAASEAQLRVHSNGSVKESDHNLYPSNGFYVRHNNVNYYSLASWKASSALEGGAAPGTGSFQADPIFVNVSGNMNQITDFELAPESPGKNMGRNGADMGANVFLIGPTPLAPPATIEPPADFSHQS